MSRRVWDKTYEVVDRQLAAMGADLFEIGALQRGDRDKPQFMLLRTWDQKKVIDAIPWLKYQDWHESHIYVRPKGESNLTLIDDLALSAVTRLRQEGFRPAAVVQTSPGNYQAWIKYSTRLDRELGTAVARDLAKQFEGDVKAADWRHFGRMAGFRNTKECHRQVVPVPGFDEWRGQRFHGDLEGQWVSRDGKAYADVQLRQMHAGLTPETRFPFVRLIDASGAIAPESDRLVATVRARLERERADRAQAEAQLRGGREDVPAAL